MIHEFNQTITYIESVLDGKVDEKKIASLSGYSYPMFSRIFSILANYPLSEYIRLRRLTKAAVELRENDEKIIELAIKYGYDSPDAFGLAFKKYHHFTPSEVRNGARFNIFSVIQLSLTIQGGKNMTIKIEKKDAFTVAGVKVENIEANKFSETWDRLFQENSVKELEELGNGQSYGVCFEMTNSKATHYMAAYNAKDQGKVKELGLDSLEVPEAEYAIVNLKGAIPNSIQEGWKYIIEVFFPEQRYKHAGTPDFEAYSEGDMYSPDYEMELWVPIVKVD
ncbi:MAG: AraC family transcriptional regulator [Carnobacterium sp.]|nr:AraC family transcriptional regulator [Carnobacterium sp.]